MRTLDRDDPLSQAIHHAVGEAPEPHDWSEIAARSPRTGLDDRRERRQVALLAAAALVLGVCGGVIVLTRSDSPSIRTDDPVITDTTAMSTEPADDVVEVGGESFGEVLPALPLAIDEQWSVTMDGAFPISAVRIDDVIVFGQRLSSGVGVSAVDARSGDLLWSSIVDADPDGSVVGLTVIDGSAILGWMDGAGVSFVAAFDAGGEVWNAEFARVIDGAIVRVDLDTTRTEVLGGDGMIRQVFDGLLMMPSGDSQLVVESEEGVSWFRVPELDRIAGPLSAEVPAFGQGTSVATAAGIVAIDEAGLNLFDASGVLLSTVELDETGTLHPVDDEVSGVLVAELPPTSLDAEGQRSLEGTTTFYEIVNGELVLSWTRPGLFETVAPVSGRSFLIHSEYVDGDVEHRTQRVIEVSTGSSVASDDLYDEGGATNGFAFTQLDDGPNSLRTVAYDETGGEIWRLQLEGLERAQIVDRGVLVAHRDSVAQTVELTFYGES